MGDGKEPFVKKKLGILGGSFDPIHRGHLNIAQRAYEQFGLDGVWFIPAGHSPNKNEKEMTPADMRAEMVALAIQDIPHFSLSTMEIDSPEVSYTYLTLTRLKERYPDVTLYFIMGADSLDYFEQWYHPEIICQKAVLLTAVRDDLDMAAVRQKIAHVKRLFPAEIYPIAGAKTDISSSFLREAVSKSMAAEGMLPKKVEEYIRMHHLYGT